MAAPLRPMDLVPPDGLAHVFRHDGIVAGGKGESGAGKVLLRLAGVPVHQPAEAFIQALDIERLGRRKGLGAAAAPEGVEGLVGITAKSAAHHGNRRRWNVGTEAVEALDADEAPEGRPTLLPSPVKQPEKPE